MTISSGLCFSCFPHHPLLQPIRQCLFRVTLGYAKAFDDTESENVNVSTGGEDLSEKVAPKWNKFSAKELGINNSKISRSTNVVLSGLKKKGFEVYLVGGCVRDLILKQVPKDFDVITSAELREVKKTFCRSEIIGERFPIFHVHIDGTIVESFDPEKPIGCDEDDYVRWKNCLQRDFTINGLMFDPFAKLVYDYLGGVGDIRKAKTVKRADLSLTEDCARILRGIRIAARLSFRISRETAVAVKRLSDTVLRLDKGRLLLEVNYIMAYGSAEASLRLLWKLGLLEILLPIQAEYFVRSGFLRRDKRYNMLLLLFSNLDKNLAPDRPCHSSLWLAILAFHKALLDRPRNPVVVATYCLAVHTGGDLKEAINIATRFSKQHYVGLCELLEPRELDGKALWNEVMSLADCVRIAVNNMTDTYFVSQAMAKYPKAPYSDLVIFPETLYWRVRKIFNCVTVGKEREFIPKYGSKIDCELLAMGSLKEVRHVFARVVFNTIYPVHTEFTK